jgi:translation initiation factor 1
LFKPNENLNSMDYALKELDKGISDIFVYTDVKKFNKPVTIIQGLNDKYMAKIILRDLKKNIGTGGTYKNGIIILQGRHQEFVEKYIINKNIIKKQ